MSIDPPTANSPAQVLLPQSPPPSPQTSGSISSDGHSTPSHHSPPPLETLPVDPAISASSQLQQWSSSDTDNDTDSIRSLRRQQQNHRQELESILQQLDGDNSHTPAPSSSSDSDDSSTSSDDNSENSNMSDDNATPTADSRNSAAMEVDTTTKHPLENHDWKIVTPRHKRPQSNISESPSANTSTTATTRTQQNTTPRPAAQRQLIFQAPSFHGGLSPSHENQSLAHMTTEYYLCS